MNLKELKTHVDLTIDHLRDYDNPEEIEVFITLSERSIGSRAFTKVKYVGMGFDWESGQFRIEPEAQIVSKGNTFSDVKKPKVEQVSGRNYYYCSRCGDRVSKNDRFCRYCGQKLV